MTLKLFRLPSTGLYRLLPVPRSIPETRSYSYCVRVPPVVRVRIAYFVLRLEAENGYQFDIVQTKVCPCGFPYSQN
jgi:hypothetical protein